MDPRLMKLFRTRFKSLIQERISNGEHCRISQETTRNSSRYTGSKGTLVTAKPVIAKIFHQFSEF